MKLKPADQLTLYRQLTKSPALSEVQMSYKSKVKTSELEKITSSRDSYPKLALVCSHVLRAANECASNRYHYYVSASRFYGEAGGIQSDQASNFFSLPV